MNKQPTEILLIFTDYLNNRDSIAFLRLSSSIWSSHRSPAGRYRLKKANNWKFARPSLLSSSSLLPLHSSPFNGHYHLRNLFLEDFDDFALVFPSLEEFPSSPGENEEIPTIFRKVQKIFIGFGPPSSPKEKAQQQCQLEMSRSRAQNKGESDNNRHLMDFSRFQHLEELQIGKFSDFPLLSVISSPSLRTFYWEREEFLPLLPDSLEELQFSHYNRPLPDPLPRGLKILKLGKTFNQPIKPNSLPAGLKILYLSKAFDHQLELGCLPIGLEEIAFDWSSFSQVFLPGGFPDSLKKLIFYRHGYSHQILPGVLPNSLEELDFCLGPGYSHPCPPLPTGLKSLQIDCPLHQNFVSLSQLRTLRLMISIYQVPAESYPPSLTELNLGWLFNDDLWKGIFPDGLKKLGLGFSFNKCLPLGIFPSSLEEIEFGAQYDSPLLVGIFPKGLKKIIFSYAFNSPIRRGIFPRSVEEIEFRDSKYNYPLSKRVFPIGLKKIRFSKIYNQKLPVGIFPLGIHTVELGSGFSHRLEAGLFPSSVRKLKISTSHPLPVGIFPDGLEEIEFGIGFQQSLLPGIFPSSLRKFKFNEAFTRDILPGVLPEFLYDLDLGRAYGGYCPLSALPPYFHPDSPPDEFKVPQCLKVPQYQSYIAVMKAFISRIGRDRQFFQRALRARISTFDQYVLAEPVDGGESFVVMQELFNS